MIYLCGKAFFHASLSLSIRPGLTQKLELAIRLEETGKRVGPWEMHREVKNTYLWSDVMRRTELVYSKVHKEESSADLVHRIPRLELYMHLGNSYISYPKY